MSAEEITGDDLGPGTGFEVVVQEDGMLKATVFYNWARRGEYYDGEGIGKTWSEAATRAIYDAEGEDYEPPRPGAAGSTIPATEVFGLLDALRELLSAPHGAARRELLERNQWAVSIIETVTASRPGPAVARPSSQVIPWATEHAQERAKSLEQAFPLAEGAIPRNGKAD